MSSYRLTESLHLKVQNKLSHGHLEGILICLIEIPSKKVGKYQHRETLPADATVSMKVPTKSREIPNAAEGPAPYPASMKAPPDRKGNFTPLGHPSGKRLPSMKVSVRKQRNVA